MSEGKYERLIECGVILRPKGLKGDLVVFWNNGVCPVGVGEEIFLSNPPKGHKISALKKEGRICLMRLEGVTDRTSCAPFVGKKILLPREILPKLGTNEFYAYQILGLKVVTEDGEFVGRIARIFTAGENDVYEILPHGKERGEEILIPAIEGVVKKIDLENGCVVVVLPKEI